MKPFAEINLVAVETYLRYWEMADKLANDVRVIDSEEHNTIKTLLRTLLLTELQG